MVVGEGVGAAHEEPDDHPEEDEGEDGAEEQDQQHRKILLGHLALVLDRVTHLESKLETCKLETCKLVNL